MDILTYGLLNKKVEEAKNVSGEKITAAVNTYLNENPVAPGATAEQAAQIDKNVADIGELKGDLGKLSEEISDCIITPTTATVGQTVVVKAVDDNSKPTEWETYDIPSTVTDNHINDLINTALNAIGIAEEGVY